MVNFDQLRYNPQFNKVKIMVEVTRANAEFQTFTFEVQQGHGDTSNPVELMQVFNNLELVPVELHGASRLIIDLYLNETDISPAFSATILKSDLDATNYAGGRSGMTYSYYEYLVAQNPTSTIPTNGVSIKYRMVIDDTTAAPSTQNVNVKIYFSKAMTVFWSALMQQINYHSGMSEQLSSGGIGGLSLVMPLID